MAFSLFSSRNKIVNIVINDHSIRFMELKQKNPILPSHFGERYLPRGIIVDGKIQDFDTLSNILDECIAEWKIAKREIRFTVPDSLVMIRKVSIPADIKEDEIHGYLYLELGSTIHLPFEDPVFDTVPLGTENNKQEVLLFAAPEKYIFEFEDLFKSVKLKPIAADISPLSIYRLYHYSDMAVNNEVLLSVQFDLDGVSLCIFENHIPVFMRHIPGGLNEKWKLSRIHADQSDQELVYEGESADIMFQLEEVYRDIAKLMDFYRYSMTQGQKEVTRILVNGDHPMLERVHSDMEARFGIPLAAIKINAGPDKEVLPNAFHLALGLGLKEV
ncbi:type IV pilus biogenesis protein PilM [Mesobacillus subterraneus]|uniref:Pilus assembly protein PilM n=1 Tax=Mesobacillus subterraneus TaxID=285983 RepID=A0A427TIA4_9BACI|nr:pilus assembly protein PilM [Mesobacillus subterraneus]RSD23314.1 pilus assembly protein PilM [Mesobacillus subterraneus]